MTETKTHEAYELRFTWKENNGRSQRDNLTLIPLHESQYNSARRYIEKHGVKVPPPRELEKYEIPKDDYLVEGYFFRLNRGNHIQSGGGQLTISIFRANDGRDISLEKLLEKASLPLP